MKFLISALWLGMLSAISVAGPTPTARPATFAYVLQAEGLAATKAGAVAQLAACGRDWLVLDAMFGDGVPWERGDLDAMRSAREGRKIVAYVSIGEAEDYRPYWRKEWGTGGHLTGAAPEWLEGENPEWKGNYRVKYWRADWQRLVLAVIDDVMARGFDGVYLDIVDGFETFEERPGGQLMNPETKQSYRRDMVEWVKVIAARARTSRPEALVIPQNGSQLVAQPDFLAVISGIGIEDLLTDGDKLQTKAHTREVAGHLEKMRAAGKPVLLVEYPRRADRRAWVWQQGREHGWAVLVTDRELRTLGWAGNE